MVKPRVPEGGAIEDNNEMSMEEYSERMKKKMGFEYRGFVKYILKNLNPPENAKVLEVGPGPGWIGIWLLKERPDMTLDGLEASPDLIRVATKNATEEGVSDRVQYIHGFVEKMDMIPHDTYDLVISNDSLHHWEDPLKGFLEIARVLKSDGMLHIEDERRDLGVRGKFILYVLGPLIARSDWKWWKSSVKASYTPAEIRKFLDQGNLMDWVVKPNFIGLSIEMF
jgi:ubiquinone/menaquinone biosynthesis C-methylase UbiE